MSRPSNSIFPPVGSSSRVISRPVVVLPQPDSPTSASVSPAQHLEVEPVDRLHRPDLALQQPPGDREVLLQAASRRAGRSRGSWAGSLQLRARSQPCRHLLVQDPAPLGVVEVAGAPGGPARLAQLRTLGLGQPAGAAPGAAARVERAARGRVSRRRRASRGSASAGPCRPVEAAASTPAGPRCRGARARRTSRRRCPSRRTRPPYITRMSSANSATTPRSWVMSMIAESNSACRSRIRSRICACTVTSSAVVGSSAISRSGSLEAPSRSSRAAACRRRTCADSRRPAGRGCGMPTRPSRSIGVRAGRPSSTRRLVHPVGLDDLRAHRVVRVQRRQWILEDHRHPAATQAPHRAPGRRADELLAASQISPVIRASPVQPHDREAGHALARPRLPDDAQPGRARGRTTARRRP